MNYWQDFMLAVLLGDKPKTPKHAADSWSDSPSPANEDEWNEGVAHFLKGLEMVEEEAEKELTEQGFGQERTRADCLLTILLHNSYHAGQAVFARRGIGAWPPPSGRDTW